jgi:hypothetical protein
VELRVRALAQAMVDNGATSAQFAQVYQTLPPALKDVFDELGHGQQAVDAYTDATRTGLVEVQNLMAAQDASAASTKGLASSAASAIPSLDEYTASLTKGESAAGDLNKALDALATRFSTLNPVAETSRAMMAAIDDELADMDASGITVGTTFGKTKDQLEAWRKTLETTVTAADSNEKATRAMDEATKAFGINAYDLDQTIAHLNIPLNDQVDVQKKITAALLSLSTHDVPGAITQFEALKKTLSPADFAAIAKAIGPAFMQSLNSSLNGPDWAAIKNLVDTMGGDMVRGMANGILRDASSVAAAMVNATAAAVAAAQSEIDSHSPSKVTEEKIGKPMVQGIAVGIAKGADDLAAVAVNAVTSAVSAGMSKALDLTNGIAANNPASFKAAFTGASSFASGPGTGGAPAGSDWASILASGTQKYYGSAAEVAAGKLTPTQVEARNLGVPDYVTAASPYLSGVANPPQVHAITINIAGDADAGKIRTALDAWLSTQLGYGATQAGVA